MDMKLIIQGINYYARKEKMYGLDEREIALRQELRESYIKLIRLSFQDQIEHVKVVDIEGNDLTPEFLKGIQRGKQIHGRHLEPKNDLPTKMEQFLAGIEEFDPEEDEQ
ncbi:DUF896 domain-containing protein [Fundicoccus sp. Sow4_D5]|uniref:DUF896 domain-containing protein n=1 Tax=unclassified Fundicoccus TaxID=2761543 RepID=UPI003F8E1D12